MILIANLIRGNVDTRLRKLKEGLYDAIISIVMQVLNLYQLEDRNNPNFFN